MRGYRGLRRPGILAALGAAVLFGAGTPLAKQLVNTVNPWLLAGLLYLGSGLGLGLYRLLRRMPAATLARREIPWLVGAIGCGGVIAPVLLMAGLLAMPATDASLLLNAEMVFTTLLAWVVFKENVDVRIALGMAAIAAGAVILSLPARPHLSGMWPTLAVLGACLAWGIDNNLTRKISLTDATWLAAVKGAAAGVVNLLLAFAAGVALPALPDLGAALAVGFFAYGVSLALFVVGLRHLGTARTGAYFSIAPFVGAVFAVMLGDAVTPSLLAAGALMALGIGLHLAEGHEHRHVHEPLLHDHEHSHDDGHHLHAHAEPVAPGTRHRHRHEHGPLTHTHPHFPDAHHRHGHGDSESRPRRRGGF
ncbi:EamA family transporter [Sodalis sp. RH21]|uniref:DMT family transporter n=1 Tax=unclassified Sodalis (in: enterobacteria) TaxID=2636512 RepID=UPI0039B655D1